MVLLLQTAVEIDMNSKVLTNFGGRIVGIDKALVGFLIHRL